MTRALAQRTCVACRDTAPRDDLVRLVLDPAGGLVIDYRAKLPGRGCWVHPASSCLAQLEAKPRMLERHLNAVPQTSGLAENLEALIVAAMLDGVSMAAAGGALVGGRDMLETALRRGRVLHVLTANDVAPRTLDALRTAADEDVPFTEIPLGRVALGVRVGKGARAALGVTRSNAASHLLRSLRRLHGLG